MDIICIFSLGRLARLGITLYQTPSHALLALVALSPDALLRIEHYHTREILWSDDMATQQLQSVLEGLSPPTLTHAYLSHLDVS